VKKEKKSFVPLTLDDVLAASIGKGNPVSEPARKFQALVSSIDI
jgi:hypothetical protein